MDVPGFQSLSMTLDPDTGELHACFDPAGAAPLPDLAALTQVLLEMGWADFYLDREAIAEFIARCRSAKQAVSQRVGTRRDGEFWLTLDGDLMSARLTLMPPQGGRPVGVELIIDALREQEIVHGVLRDRIDAALRAGQCENLMVARGDPPQEGSAASFESLLLNQRYVPAQQDERALIKYSELSHLLLVHPGDQLMRRIPSKPGKNGTDVKGQVVLAKPVPDWPFESDLQGVVPAQNDPDLLLAASAGQPVLLSNGVAVNPVIEVPDVDLSTGNIVFEGTIRVAGDIKSGMSIKVSGDVFVSGTVEAAEIVAGGNVVVQGGVIGHADTRPGTQSLPAGTARIHSKGSVQALFMEHAHVEARDAILVDRSTRQCELLAGSEIVVGAVGSKVGQIVGGLAQATLLVKAAVLGSATGIKTQVLVGIDPYLNEALHTQERLRQHKLEELDHVLKLIAYLEHNPKKSEGGVGEKAESTRLRLVTESAALNTLIAQLGEQIELVEQGRVEVGRIIHFGVEIHVGQQVWRAPDDMSGATVHLQEGKIVAGP